MLRYSKHSKLVFENGGHFQFGSRMWKPVTLRLSNGDRGELDETLRPNPLASALPFFSDPNL